MTKKDYKALVVEFKNIEDFSNRTPGMGLTFTRGMLFKKKGKKLVEISDKEIKAIPKGYIYFIAKDLNGVIQERNETEGDPSKEY